MVTKRICLTPVSRNLKYKKVIVSLSYSGNGAPMARMTALGTRGSLRVNAESEQFIFFIDELGNFSSFWEDHQVFYRSLRGMSRAVTVGEIFTYKDDDQEITYRVSQVFEVR